jgi:hypothetical protein
VRTGAQDARTGIVGIGAEEMARIFTLICARMRAWRRWPRLQRLRALLAVFVTVALEASLAACTTPQERAARAQAEAAQMMTIYGPACSRLGYAEQSDAWRNCVIALSTKYDLQHAGPPADYYGPGYWRDGWRGSYW